MDECTKADTGVGAAIAAGSQAENGIWALLVHAAIAIIQNKILISLIWGLTKAQAKKFQVLISNINRILMRNKTSPKRLVIAVIIPALNDVEVEK